MSVADVERSKIYHRTYLNDWDGLVQEWKNAERKAILVRLSQKSLGVVSGPLQLCFLLGVGERGLSVLTARRRALKVGMADFALGHEPSGRAADILGRAVTATDLIRVDDFLAQSAWLLTARTERNNMETHCDVETWHG